MSRLETWPFTIQWSLEKAIYVCTVPSRSVKLFVVDSGFIKQNRTQAFQRNNFFKSMCCIVWNLLLPPSSKNVENASLQGTPRKLFILKLCVLINTIDISHEHFRSIITEISHLHVNRQHLTKGNMFVLLLKPPHMNIQCNSRGILLCAIWCSSTTENPSVDVAWLRLQCHVLLGNLTTKCPEHVTNTFQNVPMLQFQWCHETHQMYSYMEHVMSWTSSSHAHFCVYIATLLYKIKSKKFIHGFP